MVNILFVVSTLKRSGPIVVLDNIIKYLDRNKFNPRILTLSPEPAESMALEFKTNYDLEIDTLGLSRLQFFFYGRAKLQEYCDHNEVDIIHSHGLRADSSTCTLKFNRVSTLHNYPYFDYKAKFGKLKSTYMIREHMSAIKKHVSSNIACSKSIRDEFLKHGLSIRYIQNGVDTLLYSPVSNNEKVLIRNKLNLPLDKKIITSVGSLIPRKDMLTVIKGFNSYNSEKDSLLVIIGDGPERNNCELISDRNVVFTGNVSNVNAYLKASDLFISASLSEGLPNTVLEAMATGLPVILSDISPHQELFNNLGDFFFPVGDSDKLSFLISQADFELGKVTSLNMVSSNFSAQVMSEKYQAVYTEVIDE